jgi:hypothetical protein
MIIFGLDTGQNNRTE